jgi:hypothetical protein
MSTNGNRSHPNSVRVGGKSDDGPENPNRSDITDQTQAGSMSPGGRQPLEGGGSNQENRDHNKHNHPGQSGHQPQKHGPDEEKR